MLAAPGAPAVRLVPNGEVQPGGSGGFRVELGGSPRAVATLPDVGHPTADPVMGEAQDGHEPDDLYLSMVEVLGCVPQNLGLGLAPAFHPQQVGACDERCDEHDEGFVDGMPPRRGSFEPVKREISRTISRPIWATNTSVGPPRRPSQRRVGGRLASGRALPDHRDRVDLRKADRTSELTGVIRAPTLDLTRTVDHAIVLVTRRQITDVGFGRELSRTGPGGARAGIDIAAPAPGLLGASGRVFGEHTGMVSTHG